MLTLLENLLLANFAVLISFGIYSKFLTKILIFWGPVLYLGCRFLEIKHGRRFRLIENTFLNKALFVFCGACLVSVIFSRDIYHSQSVFFQRYLLYFFTFFIGTFLARKEKNFKVLLFSLLAGSFIVALGGLFDIYKTNDFQRLFSSFGVRCLFADYFLYILPFFICFCLFARTIRARIVSFLMMIPFLIVFLYHYSRGVWIAFLLSFFPLTLIFTKFKRKIVFTFVIFVLLFTTLPHIKTRFISELMLRPVRWGDRMSLWEGALKIFKRYPVTGTGVGTYEVFVYKFEDREKFRDRVSHLHASNTYLEVLAETGLAGLSCLFFLFFVFFRYYFRKLKEKFDIYRLALAISILAVLITELTTSTILIGYYSAVLFWFFLGMAVGRESRTEGTV